VSDSLSGDSRIVVGSRVIIHKHRAVNGNANWVQSMEQFVGTEAVVKEFTGDDSQGCRMARLTRNGSPINYVFRVRDLELANGGSGGSGGAVPPASAGVSESLSGDPNIVVGSRVIINKHRAVNGNTNWVSSMDKYIGKEAVVKDFTGTDSQGCRMASVVIDGAKVGYAFRVRDLVLAGSASSGGHQVSDSLSGDNSIRVGSRVVVHKHRPVQGRSNWVSDMDAFVGRVGIVQRFTGNDSSGCRVCSITFNGAATDYAFRVRDLTLAD